MFVNANTKLLDLQVLCRAGVEEESVKPASPTTTQYPLSETVLMEKKYIYRTGFSEDTKYFEYSVFFI